MRSTKADFELFKQSCRKYIKKLGLVDWSVYYDHKYVEDGYAETNYKTGGRVATITLSTDWDEFRPKTPEEIDRLALHEVLHILIGRLKTEAQERYTLPYVIDELEHDIIRRLENIVV